MKWRSSALLVMIALLMVFQLTTPIVLAKPGKLLKNHYDDFKVTIRTEKYEVDGKYYIVFHVTIITPSGQKISIIIGPFDPPGGAPGPIGY